MRLEGAGVLLLVDRRAHAALAADSECRLADLGLAVLVPELAPETLEADRAALREIERALDELERRPGIDRERLAAVGFGRGGTLAFLLGCARRLAAVVDVDGPVLYPELSPARPIQPVELALNFEGAFLGAFAARDPSVTDEELAFLRERLEAAARPHELVRMSGASPRAWDPARDDEAPVRDELWRRLEAFLRESLAG
jgi:dienelactone hydrolase